MPNENLVAEHYSHGNLIGEIKAAISSMGKNIHQLSIDDLGPVDEFHIGGRIATVNLVDQLDFAASDHILDMGCGLGGASRFIAEKFHSRVTGVDLTQEYVDAGNELNNWVGLGDQITLQQAGFKSAKINNRREFSLEFFKQIKAENEANGGPPPLGLHTLMQATTPVKLRNLVKNIAAGNIAPIEIIASR